MIEMYDKGDRKVYLEDTPIKKQEDDLLHRRNFAKRLGKSLLETDTKDGYCIGLFGPWGSGKSSVINMVLEEIDILKNDKEEEPIVMYFNPWNFSSTDQLLQQYFLMLANKFSSQNDKRLNAIGNEIQTYSDMLDSIGGVGKILGTGGKIAVRLLKRKSIVETRDISKQREIIVKKLMNQKQKIIIIIDDIDRLSNDEIKLVFQLVNAVAKFPNTIYLLSFDKEIVARALTEVQNYDGEKYLEKIIQVPIEIPKVTNDYLWETLFIRLDQVLNSHKGIIWEQDYWGRIFSECISNYIDNIRDVVRLINVLNLKCDMLNSDVNFVDLVAITVIEIKLPKLYRWIKTNQSKLVGGESELIRLYGKKSQEIEKINLEEMRNLDEGNVDEYYCLLKLLFPYYASKTSDNSFYEDNLLRKNRRIGHEEMFERYFALEIDEKSILKQDFEYAISKMDEPELEVYLEKINSNNAVISFLKELSASKDEIKIERVPVLIKVLFNSAVTFNAKETKLFFTLSAYSMVLYRIEELFLKIENDEERFELLKNLINASNEINISILSDLINKIELSHGRLAADVEKIGKKIINLEQLEVCEKLFSQKVIEISKKKCLLDLYNSYMILYLYECFENDSYKNYMNKVLQNDLNKLKFLGLSVQKWTSGSVVSWNVNSKYTKFLSEDVIKTAIYTCLKNNDIWKLNEEQIHKVIAYILWNEKVLDWDGNVDDKKVIERIDEIKNNFDIE